MLCASCVLAEPNLHDTLISATHARVTIHPSVHVRRSSRNGVHQHGMLRAAEVSLQLCRKLKRLGFKTDSSCEGDVDQVSPAGRGGSGIAAIAIRTCTTILAVCHTRASECLSTHAWVGAIMCPSAVLLLLQVVKAITCGLFMNAAQYVRTEYNPAKTNDAGSNVYRLLRHVQPRESPYCCLPVGLAGVVIRVGALLQLVACFPIFSALMHMQRACGCRIMHTWMHPMTAAMLNRVCCASCVLCAGRPLKLRVHPSSVLFRTQPQLVVFLGCQQNDEGWYEMQGVTAIQQEWLTDLAPGVFRKA